jgi:hypothetical protein
MVSCNITTPSIMFLPGMKAVCDGLISFMAILVILLTITFVNILKLALSKHIGRNYLIWEASFCFGNSVMNPKLRLKTGNLSS